MDSPCYWQNFEQVSYIFCEKQTCGFISQPANTWTNIGYLIVAILIYRSKASGKIKRYYFWSSLALFIGSTLFHATSTYLGKFLDVSAMFFLSMSILSIACERYFSLSKLRSDLVFFTGLTGSLIFLYIMRFGNVLFAAQIIMAAGIEWKMSHKGHGLDKTKLKIAVLTLVIAFIIWILDVKKILCIPGNHILTGHGLWHLLTAATIWIFFSSYSLKKSSI